MACYSCTAAIGANPAPIKSSKFQIFTPSDCLSLPIIPTIKNIILRTNRPLPVTHCSSSNFSSATLSQSETEEDEYSGEEDEEDDEEDNGNWSASFSAAAAAGSLPPLKQKRRRYRKQYPGESKGITEEMRFVAMKLRNSGKPKSKRKGGSDRESGDSGSEEVMDEGEISDSEGSVSVDKDDGDGNGKSWQPSIEGFLKYLVDSKLVFGTIERIVDESSDVSCMCSSDFATFLLCFC